jgi:hypothetical protein
MERDLRAVEQSDQVPAGHAASNNDNDKEIFHINNIYLPSFLVVSLSDMSELSS